MFNKSKKLSIILIIIFTIFLIVFNKISIFIFSYPKDNLIFAWEIIEINDNIKKRFDKEFFNLKYNLLSFYSYKKNKDKYFPYIEEKLIEKNMPLDLKYISLIESSLNKDAISKAWAVWIWQFMPETARYYNLEVSDNIDERYDFKKSTDAALDYLSFLYNKFWSWPLALSAYNRWQTAISNSLKEQNVDNYFDLELNEETYRYFFKIITIKYILEYYEEKKYFLIF